MFRGDFVQVVGEREQSFEALTHLRGGARVFALVRDNEHERVQGVRCDVQRRDVGFFS